MTSTIRFEKLHKIILREFIHLNSIHYSLKVTKERKVMIHALVIGNQTEGPGEVHNCTSGRFTKIVGKFVD